MSGELGLGDVEVAAVELLQLLPLLDLGGADEGAQLGRVEARLPTALTWGVMLR